MNKEKVMQMIENYGEKQYDAGVNYGYEDDMDSEVFKDLEMRIYNIKKELNSKPVMPKVFNEWHKMELELCSCYKDEIINLLETCTTIYVHMSDDEIGLLKWMSSDDPIINDKRFLMCIDAIVNGYEVEK